MRWSPGGAATAAGAEQGSRLAAELGLLPAMGRALWARGVRDAEAAHRFLEPRLEELPDPFGLKGIDAAVARVQRALETREAVCVYGDYDVDGGTSTVAPSLGASWPRWAWRSTCCSRCAGGCARRGGSWAGRSRTCASSSTWSRSAPSPTWCRSPDPIACWSISACASLRGALALA